jgi:hypothetical protein
MLILTYMYFNCCRTFPHSHDWSYFVNCKAWSNESLDVNCILYNLPFFKPLNSFLYMFWRDEIG